MKVNYSRVLRPAEWVQGSFARQQSTGGHVRSPDTPMRYVPRDLHEDARDVVRALTKTDAFEHSRRERKKVEMRGSRT